MLQVNYVREINSDLDFCKFEKCTALTVSMVPYQVNPTSLALLLGYNTLQEFFPLLFDLAVISEVGTGSVGR